MRVAFFGTPAWAVPVLDALNRHHQVVHFQDLLALLNDWGPCIGCPADLDGNGDVGFTDLLLLLFSWGPCE